MIDGLYRVVTEYFVAGFTIKKGVVDKCAPVLRKLIQQWALIADWVCE